MVSAATRSAAVVGAGLIGSAWAIVFARAGWQVRLYDAAPGQVDRSVEWIAKRLADLESFSLLQEEPDVIRERVSCVSSIAEAVADTAYVQESVLERTDVKQKLYSELEGVLPADTLVGSSSSGIPASAYTGHVNCRDRCLVAHPVNPPYLIPVVEIVPSPWTAGATTAAVREIMRDIGQTPVSLSREIDGFVLNRLQGVLLRECWSLVEDGIASVEDVDATVSQGLGMRWSFMGPFETIDLNAPGGVADYAERLGELYRGIAASRNHDKGWGAELITNVESQRRSLLSRDGLAERSAWRDRRLMELVRARMPSYSRRERVLDVDWE